LNDLDLFFGNRWYHTQAKGIGEVDEERDKVAEGELDRELERRLAIIESTGAEDPARRDLSAIDFILLAVLVVLTSVLMFLWIY
jgi:hypothetical protein